MSSNQVVCFGIVLAAMLLEFGKNVRKSKAEPKKVLSNESYNQDLKETVEKKDK